jgi:hypothetical protein
MFKQPDGQISKNLSSPPTKNFPLCPSGKSSLQASPSHPKQGRLAIVTNARWDAVDVATSARKCSQGGFRE